MRHTRGDAPERRRSGKRKLPFAIRFPLKIVSAALVITLVIAFLPRITRWAGQIWPDPARTKRVSEIINHELNQSSRLETLTVDDQGVLTATVNAAIIGEVQRVTIDYDYHASIGLDLQKVALEAEGSRLTLRLPDFELLSDSLMPVHVDRQDFWYPLTEKRRSQLLAEETESRRAAALEEARSSAQIRKDTEENLRELIDRWIGTDTWLMTVEIVWTENDTDSAKNAESAFFDDLGAIRYQSEKDGKGGSFRESA